MEALVAALKRALGDTFVFAFKVQAAHWNVTGINFPQYHDFYGEIYEEVQKGQDKIAELLRTIDTLAPDTIAELLEVALISDVALGFTDPASVVDQLKIENDKVLASLLLAYQEAETQTELGISNAIQDRIEQHQKYAWMLKAAGE